MKWIKNWLRKLFTGTPKVSAPVEQPRPTKPIGGKGVTLAMIADRLIEVAESQIGVRETSHNAGKDVEKFQKVIGGADREPWCVSFVQWVTQQVCNELGVRNPLPKTEHVQTLYTSVRAYYRSPNPARGFAFIQRTRGTDNGHTGFCKAMATLTIPTVEGNTNPSGSREGDGVYNNSRLTTGSVSKEMRGYVNIPQMIYDLLPEDKR